MAALQSVATLAQLSVVQTTETGLEVLGTRVDDPPLDGRPDRISANRPLSTVYSTNAFSASCLDDEKKSAQSLLTFFRH